ncbi:ankyrin repeat domain-containing protein, partial [Endozoicomonas sp.]|nr:ankyrin repeat domain-containing protein [Endozoicomonas sp.]
MFGIGNTTPVSGATTLEEAYDKRPSAFRNQPERYTKVPAGQLHSSKPELSLLNREVSATPLKKDTMLIELQKMSDIDFVSHIIQLIDRNEYESIDTIPASLFHSPRTYYGKLYFHNGRPTILHYAVEKKQFKCVETLARKLPELINRVNCDSDYPIHLACRNGDLPSIKALIEQDPFAYQKTDDAGNNLLHLAVSSGDIDSFNFLFQQYPKLITKSDCADNHPIVSIKTLNNPLPFLDFFIEKYPEQVKSNIDTLLDMHSKPAIKRLLEFHNPIQMNHDPYTNTFPDLSARHPELYEQHRKKNALTKQPLTRFNRENAINTTTQINEKKKIKKRKVEALSLENKPYIKKIRANVKRDLTVESLNLRPVNRESNILDKAITFLAGIESVGVTIHLTVYRHRDRGLKESAGNYWSLGDASATVQIMNALIALRAKRIYLRLSVINQLNTKISDLDYPIILDKLATLIPEIDIHSLNKSDNYSINIGECTIQFLLPGIPCTQPPKEVPIWFSFHGADYSTRLENEKNFITIKPYRFGKNTEFLQTDIIHKNNRIKANSIPLHLPTHSIIPIAACDDSAHPSNYKAITQLINKSKRQQIDLAILYGLHHDHVTDSAYKIIRNYLSATQLLAQNNNRKTKPLLLAIFPNTEDSISKQMKKIETEYSVKRIEIKSENACQELDQLKPNDIALLEMPSLPKPVFEQLVNCSNLPTLAEGANLTSWL